MTNSVDAVLLLEDDDHPLDTKPPIDAEGIAAWERRFGLTLPSLVKDMLLAKNGGSFRRQHYRRNMELFEINSFTGIGMAEESGLMPMAHFLPPDYFAAADQSRLVPFYDIDSHNSFCLDYSSGADIEPAISLVDCNKIKIRQLWPSFQGMLADAYDGDSTPDFEVGMSSRRNHWDVICTAAGIRSAGFVLHCTTYFRFFGGSLLIDHDLRQNWHVTWTRQVLPLQRMQVRDVQLDQANGRYLPPIYELHLSADYPFSGRARQASTSTHEWIWFNEVNIAGGVVILDNSKSRLQKLRDRLLKAGVREYGIN